MYEIARIIVGKDAVRHLAITAEIVAEDLIEALNVKYPTHKRESSKAVMRQYLDERARALAVFAAIHDMEKTTESDIFLKR